MQIDENSRNTVSGIIHNTGTIIPMEMTVDNKVLLEIIPVGSLPTDSTHGDLYIDENSRNVLGGVDSLNNIYNASISEINNLPLLRVELI